ncbi:hypothetical protein GCM10007420_02240 [Glycocaulis albus]|uniref:Uncharacterized protein n=1 Tax=Glycocaulis albus TaxID=1382801 RepID=A0ABQ1XF81_9PROT|nr:hypothetical protein [Glycocaulis albus]GGG90634.1 hypothetical protein GCM10007420_02240 [Glycocaulis albus]
MAYSELYKRVQTQPNGRVKTSWIRDQIIDLTHVCRVHEQWTGHLNPEVLRGFYIEGPLGPPVPVEKNEILIVLARDIPKTDRRIVFTKELMHTFDEEEEKTNTAEKFSMQIEKFGDPNLPTSPQFAAEGKAYWRAIGVLCTEKKRLELRDALNEGNATMEIVATQLKLPTWVTHDIMRDDFEAIINHLK